MPITTKVIRDDNGEYQRWELPQVNEDSAALSFGLVTADKLGKIQDQAYKEAQEAGFQKGYKEGAEKARQEFAQRTADQQSRAKLMEQLLRALSAPFEQLDEQVENELATLAIALARQIIRREFKADPGEIVPVVREAINALPVAARHPQIYLHPEDAAFLRQSLSLSGNHEHWKLIDDPTLTRGDCRVATDNSRIDATVESRLRAIVAQSLGGEREEDRPRS